MSKIEITDNEIIINNASIHNVKNLSLNIPLNQFVVIVGKSGSGKSSLIYDYFYDEYKKENINNKLNRNIYVLKQKNYLSKNVKESIGEYILDKFYKLRDKAKKDDILILDEPCAGLNKKDIGIYVKEIRKLINKRISVIVIEHSKYLVRKASFVIEFGPGAGVYGGEIIFEGSLLNFKSLKENSAKLFFECEGCETLKSNCSSSCLEINNINKNNLKNYSVKFPLYSLVCITGGIGAGKSTLLEYIYKCVYKGKDAWDVRKDIDFDEAKIKGKQYIRRSYIISQNPISNNPNSIVATYINVLNEIRNVYSELKESKKLNLNKEDFNIDKNFDIDSQDKRILKVKLKGYNIYEFLNLTIDEAYKLFKDNSIIARKLLFLKKLDLGYIVLSQKSGTLSGGEAQRIKLAKVLTKKLGDRCIYLLDIPSKGLHISNIESLISAFREIIDKKNTVIIAENNVDVIKKVDYVIKL